MILFENKENTDDPGTLRNNTTLTTLKNQMTKTQLRIVFELEDLHIFKTESVENFVQKIMTIMVKTK